ncbi:hypothetical protein, partial [Nitrolancea hollandica]|uniref:hypothetical protein n=1 Tax=Nitrolancea hollandica TaxID=1206749 RepID=UPI001EE66624
FPNISKSCLSGQQYKNPHILLSMTVLYRHRHDANVGIVNALALAVPANSTDQRTAQAFVGC